MIAAERVHTLNTARVRKGRYVLYWMQSSHRASSNLALEHAIEHANNLGIPVLACFCFDISYPGANERHFQFLAEGLIAVGRALEERGIQFILMRGTPGEVIPDLASEAALVVIDTGYLGLHLTWRKDVARQISCPLIQVEDNVVVPVKTASVKEEWSAGTIRMKLHRLITRFLEQVEPARVDSSSLSLDAGGLAYEEARSLPREATDRSVAPSAFYRGGEDEAARRLDSFISHDLDRYGTLRSDPALNVISNMSPYLHYGQISPVRIAQRVLESGKAGADAFLEELIVRRELSMNFVTYNPHYDSFFGLPAWAKETLSRHAKDPREYTYTESEFERAQTHDPFWNSAQQEMMVTGKMHGYMRMYWGKKILEWSESPEEAYRIALLLNDRYELDGRDPNGYAGVAWCFGKHDRAWSERPVFGKLRYMNANGLRRKFDIQRYVDHISALTGE